MSNDCMECKQNLQISKKKSNYSQLNEAQRQAYWDNLNKLFENTSDTTKKDNPTGVESTIVG